MASPRHSVCKRTGVRRVLFILMGMSVAGGCAQSHHPTASAEPGDAFDAARPAASAAALVFDPPVLADAPAPDLAREGRGPEAFIGYAEGVTEYFYLRWDDRQSNWGNGSGHGGGDNRYERRAISEKVGALYR